MLIGGGEIGRANTSYEIQKLDQEIIKMTEKETPTLLFIGLASSAADSYYKTIKRNYNALGCETTYLKKNNLIHNKDIVEEKMKTADIIYIGGGDTIKLVERVKEYHLDNLLKEAAKRNCVLVGISAGAILLAKEGYSDAYILRGEKTTYEFIEGLDLAKLSITPHYHKDEEKQKQLEEALKHHKKHLYGIENKAAIKILDDKITFLSCEEEENVYEVFFDDSLKEIKQEKE